MAKTNANGYFCDCSCGMMNSKCTLFFRAGCPASGRRLEPNTEYPEYIRVHVDADGNETPEKNAEESSSDAH